MIKHPNRTSVYVGSVNNDATGLAELKVLRAETKVFNASEKVKALKDVDYKPLIRKVAVNGRLGKNNPNAFKYKEANKRNGWRNAYQRIALADAATLDVYVSTFMTVQTSCGSWLRSINY